MKTKELEEIKNKTRESLIKECKEVQKEIGHLQMQFQTNIPKNTNVLANMKKKLAVLQTVITSKVK